MENLSVHDWLQELARLPRQLSDLTASLEAVASRVSELVHPVSELGRQNDQTHQALTTLNQKLDGFETKVSELTILADEHYAQAVVDPLARRLIALVDVVGPLADGSDPGVFEGLLDQLLEVLSQLGVEPVPTAPGDPFDPQTMKPLRAESTSDPRHHHRVARVLQRGFRRGANILRPSGVQVLRHPTASPQAA